MNSRLGSFRRASALWESSVCPLHAAMRTPASRNVFRPGMESLYFASAARHLLLNLNHAVKFPALRDVFLAERPKLFGQLRPRNEHGVHCLSPLFWFARPRGKSRFDSFGVFGILGRDADDHAGSRHRQNMKPIRRLRRNIIDLNEPA